MLRSPLVQTHATLPEYFSQHGYLSVSMGKIFHKHPADQGHWAFDVWKNTTGGGGVDRDGLDAVGGNLRGRLGWLFSRAYGNPAILYIVAVFGVIGNIVSYWYSDKIALASSGAVAVTREQNVRLYRIVENLCITAGLPLPRLFVLPGAQINAFATGRDAVHAAVAVTQGALERLNDNELAGVLAHELSHVGNRDILLSTVVVVLAGVIAIMSDIFLRSSMWGGRGRDDNREGGGLFFALALVAALLAPIAATLVRLAISRKPENRNLGRWANRCGHSASQSISATEDRWH